MRANRAPASAPKQSCYSAGAELCGVAIVPVLARGITAACRTAGGTAASQKSSITGLNMSKSNPPESSSARAASSSLPPRYDREQISIACSKQVVYLVGFHRAREARAA